MDTASVDHEEYDAIQLEGEEMASVPSRTELAQYLDPVSDLPWPCKSSKGSPPRSYKSIRESILRRRSKQPDITE